MHQHDARPAESWRGHTGAHVTGSPLASRVVPFQPVVERSFVVEAPLNVVWDYLARVDQWPSWAPHIKRVEITPPGPVTERSRGVLHQGKGLTTTFMVTDHHYLRNWTWRGRALGIEVEHDHRFEPVSERRTQVTLTAGCRGAGAGLTIKLFTALHGRSLDRAIPLLIAEVNRLMGIRHH